MASNVLFFEYDEGTPLAIGCEVAVFQVVAGGALVASSVLVVEYDDGNVGKAVHVHLIGGYPGGGTDGIVVSKIPQVASGRPSRPVFR